MTLGLECPIWRENNKLPELGVNDPFTALLWEGLLFGRLLIDTDPSVVLRRKDEVLSAMSLLAGVWLPTKMLKI